MQPKQLAKANSLYNLMVYFAKAATAMEYNLVLVESPREESTQGTLAPITKAAISEWSNLVQHL